jgi:hypothetical protein
LKATSRLLGEILQEQSVHRSLQANVKLADLAFRESHDLDIGKTHPFEETGGILLITADAIERFSIDEIKLAPACILHERLDSRSYQRRARYGAVAVDLYQLMPVTFDVVAAKPNLVVNA